MENIELKKWVNPKTGETRVYVNGHKREGLFKVFFVEGPMCNFFEIKFSGHIGPTRGVHGGNEAVDVGLFALSKVGLPETCKFNDILEIAR